jgi:DNA-directed RNA polymerase subunit RPC12/RpoP
MSQDEMVRRPAKRMMLFCEPCGYKEIVEPNEEPKGLFEIKTSVVQTNLPTIDPMTNKAIHVALPDPKTQQLVNKASRPQPKKYKCPKCGRGVRLKELLKPYATAMDKVDQEKEKARLQQHRADRLKDGIPEEKKLDIPEFHIPEKKSEPKFLG